MPRILHSIRSVNPVGGGPIEGVKQLAAASARLGVETEIASLDAPSDSFVAECPLRVHALGPGGNGYGYSSAFVPWLRAHGRIYDAIIVNGLWCYNSFAVWRAYRDVGLPYFVYPHGMLDPWFKRTYPLKHLKKWLYWPWAEYRVLRDARAVLFTCEEERQVARQSFPLYRCNEEVVRYGTQGVEGNAEAQQALFLQRFPHLRGKRCLLSLGRVHVKKGPDLLLRAYAQVYKELPSSLASQVHLVMAGPNDHTYGQQMLVLARQLGLGCDAITWTGMVQGDLKWGCVRVADAFILPSHQENFGIAVAEALSAGVPVLLGRGVNIWPEIVQDGAGFAGDDTLDGTIALLRRWWGLDGAAQTAMRGAAISCFRGRFHIQGAAESLQRVVAKYSDHGRGV